VNWSIFNPFRSRKMTAHDLASPEAKAAAAWIETFNPLRGMTAQRMQNLFDAARDGNTVELQWLYNEIERVDPTLLVVSERRTGALASLGWSIKRRGGRKIDETLADEQLDALERCFFAVDSTNLTDACKHLAGAFFRGFAHCAPIWKDAVTLDRLDALDAWNFVRDIRTGDWYWNPSAGPSLYARDLALIPRGEIVSLVHTKHVDYPAMGIYLRSAVGEKGWGQFVERYGIPPVIIIMPPDMGDRAEEYRAHAENVARGGCGALASGSDVKYATEARGVQPFNEFLKHQQELIVLMATGGMLTTLTEAGSGTLAGGAHADSWAEIRRMDASIIASALNRQISDAVLDRAFPGRPHLAYFDFDTEATPSPSEVFDDATKARAAGYLVAQDDLEERTGYKLVKDEPAPQPSGLGAPFMNKAHAPSSTRPLADESQKESGENAVLAAFAQDTGPAADAIRALLADPSPEAAKKLLDDLPSLIPEDPALSAVIAEAMAAEFCSVPSAKAEVDVANKLDANGMEHVDGGEDGGQFTGKDGGTYGGESDNLQKNEPRTAADYRKLADDVQHKRITEICSASIKQPCKIEEAIAVLRTNPKIKNAFGEDVTFGDDMIEKYLSGRGRPGNIADPDRLKDLPIAIYAVKNDRNPKLQYLRGAINDPLNPPRGTQRVYSVPASGGPMLARAWADSGKVTSWYVETKKPTDKGGGRKRA